ncbi:hypothetical protein ACG7TL_000625 [Trametes sanguinea]
MSSAGSFAATDAAPTRRQAQIPANIRTCLQAICKMQRGLPMQPTVVLLKEGTDTSQGKPQLLSNISACLAISETLASTLGPRGMDKLIVNERGEAQITNDGATILKLLDIVHPAARTLVDIARAQDAEVGDGTTSVVLLAAQLLKEVRGYIEEGVSPHIIMKGFRKAAELAIEHIKSVQITVDKSNPEQFRSLLLKCASTSMSSKLIHSEKPFFSNMVVEAVQCLDQEDLNENLIGVKKIPGGGMQDSLLVKGVAFKKTFTYAGAEQQPKAFRNPLILSLNVELELKAEKDNAEVRVEHVSDYQAIVDAEWEIIYRKLEAIEKTGAKVVLSKLPIGDLATQWFADRDIFCAGRVAADDLQRVVQAVGGSIQSTCSDIKREHLGTCGYFEERQIGGERYNLFTECPKAKTCTLILRGGAEQFIEEVERSLHDAIMVVKRAVKNGDIVAGGGAIEMDLSSRIRKHALSIPGKLQLVMIAFAKALEVIPRQICDNAGLDTTDVLNKLRMKHANGEQYYGVDVDGPEGIRNNLDAFVWEPSLVKVNAINSATEAACLILSVDETVRAPQSEAQNPGPRAPPGAAQQALRGRGPSPRVFTMSTVLAKTYFTKALSDSSETGSVKGGLSPSDSVVEVPTLGAPVAKDKPSFWRRPKHELDSIATQPSVFDDPATLEKYRPPPSWENTHRFDPAARWTWREEYRIVRKIDLYIMVWAFIMFFSLELDRSNISQANTDNFLGDLGMTTNDFNLGNTLFKLSFLIAELPSQLVSKRVGPDIWIPSQRKVVLPGDEGGFIPDVILYLSYFYTKSELPLRLAWFWVSNYLADIVGAFMATGLLELRGVNGKAGWRYLFLIEGGLTLVIGIASYFMMPPSPTQTKAWFRPKGWFSEREETIIVNRVLRDDPSKSNMHNRQGLSVKMIWNILKDWRMWPIYALGITFMVPVNPPQTYLTLSLKNLGYTTTQANLLSIPSKVLGVILLLIFCYLSEIIDSRVVSTVLLQFWALPLLVALYTFNQQTSPWVYFAVVTLITGFPYVHPVQVAWASTNSGGVDKRGNRVLIAICVMNIFLYLFVYCFYKGINKRRDKIWDSWTAEEQQEYLEKTKDQGNSRMNFRFAY